MPYDSKKAVSFVQSKSGRYSDGECWTLAKDAVVSAGGTAPAPTALYVWGAAVKMTDLQAGDVLQFSGYAWLQLEKTEVVFSHPDAENKSETFVNTLVDMKRGEPQHTAIVINVLAPGLVEAIEQNIPPVSGSVQTITLALSPRKFAPKTEVVKYRTNINGTDVDATQTITKTITETVNIPPRCYRPK